MSADLKINNQVDDLKVGIVVGRDIRVQSSPEKFQKEIADLVQKQKESGFPPDDLKQNVRKLLRSGGFKPSGRNKPASEYLAQAAREDRFPLINNLVDINNYVSLMSGFPISLLDLAATGEDIVIRYGEPGEKYVFNASGQEIDIKGLIVVCQSTKPLGNPVKDSMEGKIKESTKDVIGFIYAPRNTPEKELLVYVQKFETMVREYAGASSTQIQIV